MRLHRVLSLLFLFVVLFLTACSGKEGAGSSLKETEVLGNTGPDWPALVLLKTGENPIWFELGEEGPHFIESPAAAALSPYMPWPHARFVSGILLWEGFLVMAVNQDGFLILGAGTEEAPELVLYRVSDILWDLYTAESFFIWDDEPVVLLYRNDFFSEPEAPYIGSQIYVLDKSCPVPVSSFIPALSSFPEGSFWETELLRRGPDGFWYYRMREKGKAQNETAYFRAMDLEEEGDRISVEEWRDSFRPESLENAPPRLAAILDQAAEFGLAGANAVRAISPDFEGPRLFGSVSASPVVLNGYCRETPEPFAVAVLAGGRGLCSYGEEPGVLPFSLPALPEGFVYTGIALLGNVLTAAWEEQQEAGIGAAGFMVMNIPPLEQILQEADLSQ